MPRSVATSAPRFPAFLSRPPLPLIIGALFALLLLGLFLSSPPTPSLPTSVPAHDRLANFHPVSEVNAPTPALYKPHPSPASHSHHGQFPSLLVRWAINRCGDVTEKKSGPALSPVPSLAPAFFPRLTSFQPFPPLPIPPAFLLSPLQVRWAIIGCGDVTEKKSGPALALIPSSRLVAVMRRNATLAQDYAQRHHVPRWGLALALIPSSHLVAVMRRNATLAQDYAQRHHVPRWSTNAEETINDADVNAVYIATPHRYHKQYAIMAARAGKPAYVEKPMGMSHVDSSDILAAFQRAKLPLFVAYYRRALPNFLRIKALLESGAIGDVLSVQVVYHRPPNKYDYQWALSGVPSQKELQTMLQQQQQERRGGNEEGSGAREQQQRQYPYRPLPQHHPAGASLHNATLKWRVDPLVGGLGGYFRDKGSHQLDLLDFWFGPVVSACEEGELGECAFESTQNPFRGVSAQRLSQVACGSAGGGPGWSTLDPAGASLHNASLKWHVDPLVGGLGGQPPAGPPGRLVRPRGE
ncbi:unnamed protein product [Closterium sp. NIES-65]|nr:unnamed protein product [Closterium sp. NIES-65]